MLSFNYINIKGFCIALCLFLNASSSISAQTYQSGNVKKVDFYDEALRLFGTASTGSSITENRALQGNRIVYHKNGNLYPDESAVKYFSLDYGDKRAGDFSVRFDATTADMVGELGSCQVHTSRPGICLRSGPCSSG